jgi:serine/threonine protein kinase
VWKSRSEESKAFIKLMMNLKADQRPTAAECLQNSWMLKTTDDPVDEEVAQNALRTLRKFRATQKL